MKRITVIVSKKHWAAAEKAVYVNDAGEGCISGKDCPIAQALRSQFPGCFIDVDWDKVYFGKRGRPTYVYNLDANGVVLALAFCEEKSPKLPRKVALLSLVP